MRDEVETSTSDRQRRTSSSDALFGDDARALLCDKLHVGLEAEFGAGARHEVLSIRGSARGKVACVENSAVACRLWSEGQLLLTL